MRQTLQGQAAAILTLIMHTFGANYSVCVIIGITLRPFQMGMNF